MESPSGPMKQACYLIDEETDYLGAGDSQLASWAGGVGVAGIGIQAVRAVDPILLVTVTLPPALKNEEIADTIKTPV